MTSEFEIGTGLNVILRQVPNTQKAKQHKNQITFAQSATPKQVITVQNVMNGL